MRIWLATVGEPLPIDGENVRLLRTGQFAEWLAGRGHDVTFFTGTMDHYRRRLRTGTTTTYQISSGYKIVALAGRHYSRTISVARFRNHADVARSFRAAASSFEEPDVILASYPTEELCRAILDYAEPRGIPVAIDIRDFWPDIFSEVLPPPLRLLAPLAFYPLERAVSRTLARATAVSGMTESALQWALKKAGRNRRECDFWFPFSYTRPLEAGAIRQRSPAEDGLRVCFLGTLSRRSNLEVLIDAFGLLERGGITARLTICGIGELESTLKIRAAGLGNIEFLGWLGAEELQSVMRQSDLGALPYIRPDFHMSLPNKCIEYLAGGLPVLSCTEGEVCTLIQRRGCGVWTSATPAGIARAIAGLAAEPEQLSVLKANAAAVFDDTFEQNIVFGKALGALEHLAQKTVRLDARESLEGNVPP
jgi:glycosyltransferase involved in cell wall biosynthesis